MDEIIVDYPGEKKGNTHSSQRDPEEISSLENLIHLYLLPFEKPSGPKK